MGKIIYHRYFRVLISSASFVLILNILAIYKYVQSNGKNEKDPDRTTYDLSDSNKLRLPLSIKNLPNKYVDIFHNTGRKLLNTSESEDKSEFIEDIFTLEEKRSGYVVLHCIGVLYMFLGIALVCDEFFVPALHTISTILRISDDVAGATFMAAGGSAPELFISIIGVFISRSNVGFGTIVGSAVFNILFVIGMCAMFSKTLLQLTWWPLLRDCLFYICALIMLIAFFENQKIEYYEALLLFIVYIAYVVFMAFNARIEAAVKSYLANKKSCVTPIQDEGYSQVYSTFKTSLSKNAFRHGAVQLLIHTLDPIAEVNVKSKFENLRVNFESISPIDDARLSIASQQKVHVDANDSDDVVFASNDKTDYGGNEIELRSKSEIGFKNQCQNGNMNSNHTRQFHSESELQNNNANNRFSHMSEPDKIRTQEVAKDTVVTMRNDSVIFRRLSRTSSRASQRRISRLSTAHFKDIDDDTTLEEEDEEPVDLSWPESYGEKIFYIIKMPLLILMVITLPDVRRPRFRKFFPVTFIGSILWIGGLTYLMVWWTHEIGKTSGIDDEIMGLTFLAAGTSIPDLITSVVVARQGFGDMAVSSSVGSNIFDVTVGLPVPWLIRSLTNGLAAVTVQSDGLFCSTILLFLMLVAVVVTIAVCRWRMTKCLGGSMFALYCVFITLTILLQLDIIECMF